MIANGLRYDPIIDRTNWASGPWDKEFDIAEWTDRATGYNCVIMRTSMGNLDGYVELPSNHKYYEVNYDDVPVNVHGGLTFGGHGRLDNSGYFVGFDTAHLGDMYSLDKRRARVLFYSGQDHYWTFEEVLEETRQLAKQLKELE